MANTVISPNMGMPVPVVSTDPGPDWSNHVNASLSIIDSHDHSAGQGVPVTPDGLNINADLSFIGNNATVVRSVRFDAQTSPLALTSDVGVLYESGVDLYYNDGSGNQIRMTQGGSVTGATGTITGLPSGTASATYSGGTFTFQSATSTPATMNIGPIVTGAAVANSKTWTISSSASQASNLTMTLPLTAATANQTLVSDGSGNLSWSLGLLPIGSVIATFPNLTGAYSTVATTAADAYGFVLCQGQTIVDATSPMNGQVIPNISNSRFLRGSTSAGSSGGASSVTLTTTELPAHTHAFTSTTTVADNGHTHLFYHTHQWGLTNNATPFFYSTSANDVSSTSITTGSSLMFSKDNATTPTGSGNGLVFTGGYGDFYTTGALSAPNATSGSTAATNGPNSNTAVSGTTNSTGSGTAFSILPPYINSVYLMRIK